MSEGENELIHKTIALIQNGFYIESLNLSYTKRMKELYILGRK